MIEILVVEDDADIRDILAFNLENAGYKVLTAPSAEEALALLSPEIALILLDVMLPGMTGFQMARQLRKERHDRTPIIFLTARGTENDVLTGFSAGGDDYIPKPFSVNEVLARVKAVLRRSGSKGAEGEVLEFGSLRVDLNAKTVSINGGQLNLSRKEYDLLALLASHHDTYFSRASVIARLWKDSPYVLDRTVDVHIARIRSKLGRHRELIKNKSGFGYYLDSHYEVQED